MIRLIQGFFNNTPSCSIRAAKKAPLRFPFAFYTIHPKTTSPRTNIKWMTQEQAEELANQNLEKRLREIISKANAQSPSNLH